MLLASDAKEFKNRQIPVVLVLCRDLCHFYPLPTFTVIPGIHTHIETENFRLDEQAEVAGYHTNQVTLLNSILFHLSPQVHFIMHHPLIVPFSRKHSIQLRAQSGRTRRRVTFLKKVGVILAMTTYFFQRTLACYCCQQN